MDLLFEFLIELILESSIEASKSRKVPRLIRYPLIVLLSFFMVGVLVGVGVAGVYVIVSQTGAYNVLLGVVLLLADAVLWISAVRKIYRYLKGRGKTASDEKGDTE